MVVKARFPGVDGAELPPVGQEVIGQDAFRVGKKKPIEGTLNGVEAKLHADLRQGDNSPTLPKHDMMQAPHACKYRPERQGNQILAR